MQGRRKEKNGKTETKDYPIKGIKLKV